MLEKTQLKYQQRIRVLKDEETDFKLEDIMEFAGSKKKLVYHIEEHIKFLNNQDKFKASRKYKNLLDKIVAFDEYIDVRKVGERWMDQFKFFLKKHKSIKSEQTVSRYLKFTKTILNNAFKANIKVDNSGLRYRISIPKVIKPKLSLIEIKEFENFNDKRYNLTRDTFLMQFYMRGSRIGDVLSLSTKNISKGRIVIKEQKTKKVKSLPITENLKVIIDRYSGLSKFDYILPWMDLMRTDTNKFQFDKRIESKTAIINRQLKTIASRVVSVRATTY